MSRPSSLPTARDTLGARRAGRTMVVLVLVALLSVVAPPGATAQAPGGEPYDCLGPVTVPEPGTAEWDQLNAANAYCARQRDQDKPAHAVLDRTAPADAYREPVRHDDVRFRHDETSIGGLEAEVYRPCDAASCPGASDDLETFEPPYPAVVVFHGGGANRSLYWWATQPLAEAGYLVVAFDSPGGPTLDDGAAVLDWLDGNEPLAADFDGERLGIAGHSRGGVVVSELGQRDPRVAAVVAWDRAQSTPLPADLDLATPTMFMFADYNCQQVPVCNPEDYVTAPDPDGPGNKGDDFSLLAEAGVDTMQVPLRAALHLDWTPSQLAGNRYVEPVTTYFTLAWFDRYVRGETEPDAAARGFDRLTATEFDDSADRHTISQGTFDPDRADPDDPYAGNVPYAIEGLPVADRLSFFFRAKCSLTVPGTDDAVTSSDIRTDGCEAPEVETPASSDETASPPLDPGAQGDPDRGSSVVTVVAVAAAAAVLVAGGLLLLLRRRSRRTPGSPGSASRARTSRRSGGVR